MMKNTRILVPRLMTRDDNLNRLILISISVFLIMSILSGGRFVSMRNFRSMSYSFPELGILAIGVMLCMTTGGIDLSVVGTANLTSILAARIMVGAISPEASSGAIFLVVAIAVFVSLVSGALCGLLNGFLISTLNIHPVLVTLGTWQVYSGIAIAVTKGYAVPNFPDMFLFLGNGTLFGLAVPLYVFIVVALLISVILSRTQYGINVYLMGTNVTAAKFAGIRVRSALLRTYIASALLAATAGIIMISRTNQAKADYGESYILQVVLVNLLGGVNWSGGFGRVSGIVLAVMTLQFLSSGFSMLRFNNFARDFTWGVFLIIVMVFNHLLNERNSRRLADIATH